MMGNFEVVSGKFDVENMCRIEEYQLLGYNTV
jgi:hypothetical protein